MEGRLSRLEAVQTTILEISQLSTQLVDVADFLRSVHVALGRIMYSANFYVALYHPEDNTIRFVYSVDEFDPTPDPNYRESLADNAQSPTARVILGRKPLVMTAAEDAALEAAVGASGTGARAEHWMGFPLLDQQKHALGAMVIQSYSAAHIYSEEDQALFGHIANHVSLALQSLQSIDRLERAVEERTESLAHEIAERRRAETIQRALYQIADLSFSEESSESLYARLHQIIGQLLAARNFYIALYDPDIKEIAMQYFVDEKDAVPAVKTFPLGVGLTSYVIRTRQAQLLDVQRLAELTASGQIKRGLGNMNIHSWLGVPILMREQVTGVIVVQSYDPSVLYTNLDSELLTFVASHVSVALTRIEADRELRQAKSRLEQQNISLNEALRALQDAQLELVRQERLASLGRLVAGVAHEINTPLGICVTATSHLVEELRLHRKSREALTETVADTTEFYEMADQSLRILTTNIRRAAELVRSFKQVAVDQTSNDQRTFYLRRYLDEVLLSLQPRLKGRPVKVELDCDPEIQVNSYPGAISQIVTNLVMNSLAHGFENNAAGTITMRATIDDELLDFSYADSGSGMAPDALDKLFDPFYTTKRGQGGSGLGAHIVYNLVTGVLGGKIKASSPPGSGLTYSIRFPRNQKAPATNTAPTTSAEG